MEREIKELIARHYKRAQIMGVAVDIDRIVLNVRGVKMEWVAKRLLDKYPQIYWVFAAGGWVYSRETLKWLGY